MTRVYLLEARSEFLKLARMKSYAISTILFPLMFYCFFGLAMPSSPSSIRRRPRSLPAPARRKP